MDRRSWADHYNATVDGAFYQYLVGNRTFEESAVDAIEILVDENTSFIERMVENINDIIKDLSFLAVSEGQGEGKDDLMGRLEELRDDLSVRFDIEFQPVLPATNTAPPTANTTPSTPKSTNGEPKTSSLEVCDIMAMMGGA
jgi:hypothetical protein